MAEYAARSKGIRPAQWDLSWDEFKSIRVGVPPVGVQRAIAGFLDAETARIDALITKKRRLTELLAERRQSLITAAVVADDESMSWRSTRLKHLAFLITVPTGVGQRPYVALESLTSWTGTLVDEDQLDMWDPRDSAGVAAVEPRDVLFGKLRPYLAKSWVADRPVYASTELLCLSLDPPFSPGSAVD